ncbi:hypothetical protein DFP83_1092 [Idiomarina fontislapidosi]|uniref:Transposase n=1 Tax=Idiomarina fontislapidosi TaxID=263723 RepID=A0A432XTT7_9GAMM|nr:TniB family NTP-binding protein [Idiomarina fontislapidosi]PYE31502.1 hypothetical protein DFP83_1092 [Idiomarina fontislapidosi]RUO52137.1 transposase [Idiomarina fontislapidosi]
MDELKHIDKKYRQVALLPDEERIAFIQQKRWIGYPVALNAIQELKALMEQPTQQRMRSALLIGDSNNGKSSIIEKFCEAHGQPVVNEDEILNKPVLVTEVSAPKVKDIYISILEEFWAPFKTTQTESQLRAQSFELMRVCGVKMLILDEFHTLLAGTAQKRTNALAELKMISNKLKIPIVGVGTKDALSVIRNDPQLQSRFWVMELPLWKPNTDFARLLSSFEKALPLKHKSNLASKEIGERIHTISGGNLGNVHELLKICAIEAIHNGRDKIDLDIVESFSWFTPTRGQRAIKLT